MNTPLTIKIGEVQPRLTRLLRDRTEVVKVIYGRRSIPVLALVPWNKYVAWKTTLAQRVPDVTVIVEQKKISEASSLFLSYEKRIEPLLRTDEAHSIRVIEVTVHNEPVGAIVSWQAWVLGSPRTRDGKASDERREDRTYTIVTARKHMTQFPTQFAREQAHGTMEAVTVTKQGEPTFAIVPWPLYQLYLAAQASLGENVVILQPRQAGREASFWYSGVIARTEYYDLLVTGSVACRFHEAHTPDDSDLLYEEEARQEARDRGLTDANYEEAIHSSQNNWFEMLDRRTGHTIVIVAETWTEGIRVLEKLTYARDQEGKGTAIPEAPDLVLEVCGEKLSYSHLFDEYDKSGEKQLRIEEQIAGYLIDQEDLHDLLLIARWIIACVVEAFSPDISNPMVEVLFQLLDLLQAYLLTWKKECVDGEGPDEDEAAQADRDMLLLTLRFLRPEWVTQEQAKASVPLSVVRPDEQAKLFSEVTTIRYKITPALEEAPKRGDVLHGGGLTNWHLEVLRVGDPGALHDDGTLELNLTVERTEIGKENRPCPVCRVSWMRSEQSGEGKEA